MDATKTHHWITNEERTRVSQAVARAEALTCGEIVPVVARRCDDYSTAHWMLGVIGLLVAGFLFYLLAPEQDPHWIFWIEIGGFVAGWLLSAIPPIKRALIGPHRMRGEVEERGLREFQRLHLAATQGRTGILILISLLERQVVVLADEAIHTKVGAEAWNGLVKQVTSRLGSGARLAECLEEAIAECGVILARHFPPGPENPDELANELVVVEN